MTRSSDETATPTASTIPTSGATLPPWVNARNAAILLHAVPTVGLLLQGLLYLTTEEFMPYHAEALAARWTDLSPRLQGFVLGVIRGMGAGSTAVAAALLVMLAVPFRRGERWATWAVPMVGMMFTLLTAYAAYTIESRTPATTPWRPTVGLAVVYVAGLVVSVLGARGVADVGNGPRMK